jgi:hypothetical protein
MYQAERALTEKFRKSGTLKGASRKEVKVGFQKPPLKAKAKNPKQWSVDASLNVLSRKIDLVVENDKEVWILESKLALDPHALGQVMTYGALWKDDFPQDSRRVRLGIVCYHDDPKVRRVAEAQGVTIFKVPRDS